MKARSRYYQHIHDILNNIVDSQEAAIQKAALEMTQCIEKGHTIMLWELLMREFHPRTVLSGWWIGF